VSPVSPNRRWSPATEVVVAGRPAREPDADVSPPISLTSTYVASTDTAARGYARSSNRTWSLLEEALGRLEGGEALVFASGMAAISAALELVPHGGVVVVPDGAYAVTLALLGHLAEDGRVVVRPVPVADTAAVVAALDGADLLWVESPTNPLLDVAEVGALCAAARERGVLSVVDNTFATPLLQRPLELGADVVVHAVTKFLAGHSDVLLGAAVTADAGLRERLLRQRTLRGGIAGPFETWLALRGLRTLALRLERSQASAAVLAARLAEHPAVERVRYPGLAGDPGHARAAAQMAGFGAIVSIEVRGGAAAADRVQGGTHLWVPATSLGGVESLLERRRRQPAEPLTVPEHLVRLSVGVEDVEDLWADLAQALDATLDPAHDAVA
jgi:cystathionine gamma-synthase